MNDEFQWIEAQMDLFGNALNKIKLLEEQVAPFPMRVEQNYIDAHKQLMELRRLTARAALKEKLLHGKQDIGLNNFITPDEAKAYSNQIAKLNSEQQDQRKQFQKLLVETSKQSLMSAEERIEQLDTIKLVVSQIPRDLIPNELRTEFTEISQTVLEDVHYAVTNLKILDTSPKLEIVGAWKNRMLAENTVRLSTPGTYAHFLRALIPALKTQPSIRLEPQKGKTLSRGFRKFDERCAKAVDANDVWKKREQSMQIEESDKETFLLVRLKVERVALELQQYRPLLKEIETILFRP